MECPRCGYLMGPRDLDCPRCQRMGLTAKPASGGMLSRTIHPLWVLLPLSVILAPVGFIMGIVYLAKPDPRDRFAGLVAALVSASIMFLVWFNFLLNS